MKLRSQAYEEVIYAKSNQKKHLDDIIENRIAEANEAQRQMAVWRQDERRRSNEVNQEIVKMQINQNGL